MTTLMPAVRHSRNGRGHTGAQRIGKADEADELERKIVLRVRPSRAREGGPGNAEHAQSFGRHGVDRRAQRSAILGPR